MQLITRNYNLIRSICHFSNTVTFGEINDEAIADMEKFVQNDLLEILCDEGMVNEQIPLKNFFGLYHAKTTKFRFMPGEKIMIKQIAVYIKEIYSDSSSLDTFKAPKTFKISRKDTFQLFGDNTLFGKLNNTKHKILDFEQQPSESGADEKLPLRFTFLAIAKEKYESKYPELVGKEYLRENMVTVKKHRNRIVGTVECIFCSAEKKVKIITVQYHENSVGMYYWNFSNMFKHFKKHTEKNTEKTHGVVGR